MSSAPKTFSASRALFGTHLSEIERMARITPSASRSAMSWPGSTVSAKASDTSSVIGIGHSVPSLMRIVSTTLS
jgi:DNA-binding transcriptional regulator YdaS (Cro superfamily)